MTQIFVVPMPPNDRIVARFWATVVKSAGCWERGNRPYSRIWDGQRSWLNHRFSWLIHNGAIPDGIVVCHACDNAKCVRPDHLFLGTQRDNIRDCHAKGRADLSPRGISADNAHKTHCDHGHEFSEENTIRYTRKNGRERRICRSCRTEAGRRFEATRCRRKAV